MGNVIDIRGRLKKVESNKELREAPVLDLTEKRQAMISTDRRKVKRTILTEFIAVHCVVPGCGLQKVSLYDINENGVSFDLEEKQGSFALGDEIAMRVYLNHQTYFSFVVTVKHVTFQEDEAVTRHGAEFVKGTINDVALHHFIKFIETVSASLRQDKGDVTVSSINS